MLRCFTRRLDDGTTYFWRKCNAEYTSMFVSMSMLMHYIMPYRIIVRRLAERFLSFILISHILYGFACVRLQRKHQYVSVTWIFLSDIFLDYNFKKINDKHILLNEITHSYIVHIERLMI